MVRQALPAAKIRRSAQVLINRKGEVVARFAPDVTADDPRLVAAIDAELAAGS
jgi:glutathione peroxidase